MRTTRSGAKWCLWIALVLLSVGIASAQNPSLNLDQCQNGKTGTIDCANGAWVNGNAGPQNSFYHEGQTLAYRIRFGNLLPGSHTVVIGWDITKNSAHALDYLTSANRTNTEDACTGALSSCTAQSTYNLDLLEASSSTRDPSVPYSVCQDEPFGIKAGPPFTACGENRVLKMYGASLSGAHYCTAANPCPVGSGSVVSPTYSANMGTATNYLSISFTIDASGNPNCSTKSGITTCSAVLTWGAHISKLFEWFFPEGNTTTTAANISGSPYHTSLVGFDGSGGSAQDRSLKAAAVHPDSIIAIQKDLKSGTPAPSADTNFGFTGIPGSTSTFNVTVQAGQTSSATTNNNFEYTDSTFTSSTDVHSFTVTETTIPTGYQFDSMSCTVVVGLIPLATWTTVTNGVDIDLTQGNFILCTAVNKQAPAKLELKKTLNPSTDAGRFDLSATDGTNTVSALTVGNGGTSGTGGTTVPAGNYTVTETGSSNPATSLTDYVSSLSCVKRGTSTVVLSTIGGSLTLNPGDDVVCTFTNSRKPKLIVIKHVVNTGGGLATAADFTMHVKNSAKTSDLETPFAGAESPGTAFTDLAAGTSYAVTEDISTTFAGMYTASYSTDCTGTLAAGDVKTCTVTNTYIPPHLTVIKTPDTIDDTGYIVYPGGTATFTITITNDSSAGRATSVALSDTLPDSGIDWITVVSKYNGTAVTGKCTISGTPQKLACTLGDMLAGDTWLITVTSDTIPTSFLLPPAGSTGTGLSTFEIDGNLTVTTAGNKDWANIGIVCPSTPGGTGAKGCALDKATGQTDNSFGQGTKEDTAVPTVVSGSIPNNKSDLTRFYVATEHLTTTNPDKLADYLYLAWERVQEPNGTTNMDFEFNQSQTKSSNNVTPVRTAGDLLIMYDLSQGGSVPTLAYSFWVTADSATGTPADECEANNSFPCWGKRTTLPASGDIAGAVNASSTSDPLPPNAPRTLSAYTFGEAKINLQLAGIFSNPTTCVSFGSAYLKSRSSDSFTSEVKDFIAPIPITISNCTPVLLNNTATASGTNVTSTNSTVSDTGQIQVTPPPQN